MEDQNNDTTNDKNQNLANNVDEDEAGERVELVPLDDEKNSRARAISRNEDRQLHHVKLNSLEERQLDQLFGADQSEAQSIQNKQGSQKEALFYQAELEENDFEDYQNDHSNHESRDIEQQFKKATGGLTMPSGPKSRMVMKFDFEDMSDSEGENDKNSSQELPVSSLLASNKIQ